MLLTENVENDDLSRLWENEWNGKFVFGGGGGFVRIAGESSSKDL
jgi:hypothetical protein